MEEWVANIRTALKEVRDRPRNMLVLINPFGGARKALQVWQNVAEPVFQLTGAQAASYFQSQFQTPFIPVPHLESI